MSYWHKYTTTHMAAAAEPAFLEYDGFIGCQAFHDQLKTDHFFLFDPHGSPTTNDGRYVCSDR